jgi:RHS repeat-associated protein
METANAGKENALFSNISSTAVSKPVGFGNDNSNQMVSKFNGNINTGGNKRVGPSIILKVMTGDTISISTLSWYQGAVQPAATGVTAISTELIPLLTAGVGAENGSKLGSVPTAYSSPLLVSDIATLISDDSSTYVSTGPKAFLNWMVVGEDYVAATSSPNHVNAIQIPVCNSGDTSKQIVGLQNMVVRRNGWIYIYLSNESAMDVFFDNLVINLKHGPLVEQKDYYAFGMENPALSTQAIKQPYDQNRYKYNGIEYDTAFGLNEYEAHFRDLDPVLGRWTTIDPKIENGNEDISPYASMIDNPIITTDPLGDTSVIGSWLDSHGLGFREPTDDQWGNHPIQSAVSETGYGIAKFFGLTEAESTARTLSDPNVSTTDKVVALAGLGLAMTRGEHGASEKVTEKPVVKEAEAIKVDVPGGPKTGSEGGPGAGKPFSNSTKVEAKTQANGKCVFCGEKTDTGPSGNKGNTDHAIPKSRNGNNTIDNAQHTCANCNQLQKKTMTTQEYLKQKKSN